jgi:hypothetical protein
MALLSWGGHEIRGCIPTSRTRIDHPDPLTLKCFKRVQKTSNLPETEKSGIIYALWQPTKSS